MVRDGGVLGSRMLEFGWISGTMVSGISGGVMMGCCGEKWKCRGDFWG